MRAAAIAALFALGACKRTEAPQASPPPADVALRKEPPQSPSPPPSLPAASDEESCVDRWLAERRLDPYGHPEGTVYTGGTPLFDERTGETKDRLTYVYGRHPEAKAACHR